jgi:hypothetical protein
VSGFFRIQPSTTKLVERPDELGQTHIGAMGHVRGEPHRLCAAPGLTANHDDAPEGDEDDHAQGEEDGGGQEVPRIHVRGKGSMSAAGPRAAGKRRATDERNRLRRSGPL